MNKFQALFQKVNSVVLGMIHVQALPGTPKCRHSVRDIIGIASREAKIFKEAQVDGVIIENCHDVPFLHTNNVGPEVTACMSAVCCKVREICPDMPLGIQILAGANQEALAVAQAAGLNFIRAEGFVFSHVADEGIMNACAGQLLRYRKQIGADNILVFTDVKKKHSAHAITSDVDIADTAKAAEFFLSDGIIVTGTATGAETNPKEISAVQNAVRLPVLVGSGVTIDNVQTYMDANAMIIGSHFKRDGRWESDLDENKVTTFMDKVRSVRTVS